MKKTQRRGAETQSFDQEISAYFSVLCVSVLLRLSVKLTFVSVKHRFADISFDSGDGVGSVRHRIEIYPRVGLWLRHS